MRYLPLSEWKLLRSDKIKVNDFEILLIDDLLIDVAFYLVEKARIYWANKKKKFNRDRRL